MAKLKDESDSAGVAAHIAKFDPAIRPVVEKIRQIILKTDKSVGERIRWNNPSFFDLGKMKPFAPKEYKREIAVFNLHKNRIMPVFPSGAKVNDTSGLLKGDYKEGRRIVIFTDLDDVDSKRDALQNVVRRWLEMVE